MQNHVERFRGTIRFSSPFDPPNGEWRFFFRDVFTMFLRWTKPIILSDGTASMSPRLMRRRVRGQWQYRELTEGELQYILAIENGTHC